MGTMMSHASAKSASAGTSVFLFFVQVFNTSGSLQLFIKFIDFYNASFPNTCSVRRKLIDQLTARPSQSGY